MQVVTKHQSVGLTLLPRWEAIHALKLPARGLRLHAEDEDPPLFSRVEWVLRAETRDRDKIEMDLVFPEKKMKTCEALAFLEFNWTPATLPDLIQLAASRPWDLKEYVIHGTPIIALNDEGDNTCGVICRGPDDNLHLAKAMYDGGSGWPAGAVFLGIRRPDYWENDDMKSYTLGHHFLAQQTHH